MGVELLLRRRNCTSSGKGEFCPFAAPTRSRPLSQSAIASEASKIVPGQRRLREAGLEASFRCSLLLPLSRNP